jgi:hypothetical protein
MYCLRHAQQASRYFLQPKRNLFNVSFKTSCVVIRNASAGTRKDFDLKSLHNLQQSRQRNEPLFWYGQHSPIY